MSDSLTTAENGTGIIAHRTHWSTVANQEETAGAQLLVGTLGLETVVTCRAVVDFNFFLIFGSKFL